MNLPCRQAGLRPYLFKLLRLSMEKPTIPKGTRDFGPAQMAKRQFILENIKKVFQKYGFQPLETPAMENLSTLTGKYGEEGDQLLFKVLNSGDYLEKSREKVSKVIEDILDSIFEKITSDQKSSSLKIETFLSQYLTDRFNSDQNFDLNSNIISFLNSRNYELSRELFDWFGIDPVDQYPDIRILSKKEEIRDANVRSYFLEIKSGKLTNNISEKGLRYDLTVPFARYVVMNRGEITFPFKRYQIQPVWRADRPQKGRYRG